MTRLLSLLVMISCAGCSDPEGGSTPTLPDDERESNAPPSESTQAGGSTEDFTGDFETCSAHTPIERDDASLLGFAPASVLARSTGQFEIEIRWVAPCHSPEAACSNAAQCDDVARYGTSSFASSETTVTIDVQPGAGLAVADHATAEQPYCAEGMSIPVRLAVRSADGGLDEVWDATLGTLDGSDPSVSLSVPLSELAGAIADDASFPSDARFDMQFGFYDDKVWMELEVVAPGAGLTPPSAPRSDEQRLPLPLLWDLLPPFDRCTLELPRDSVAR
jgi:hypothetical protein